MGAKIRLHDGLRALYPDAVVFGAIGTSEAVRELNRLRELLDLPPLTGKQSELSIAVSAVGLTIWAECSVLTIRLQQLAAVGVDEGALDVTAIVSGSTTTFSLPLAAPAESAQIANGVLAALS